MLNAKLTMVISGRNEGWKENPSMEHQENENGKTDKSIIDFFVGRHNGDEGAWQKS